MTHPRLILGCLALAFAWHARAADRIATPTTFDQTLKASACGDTISLAGAFGDLQIRDRACVAPITLRQASGSVRSVTVYRASGVVLDGLDAVLTPDGRTTSSTPAVSVNTSSDVVLRNSRIRCGLAVNGVAEDALARDATDNVLGRPTGTGVSVYRSQRVTVERNDVSDCDRGIGIGGTDITVIGNRVHDLRRTSVLGAGLNNVLIQGNRLGPSRPWNWGRTPLGDHADCMAFWTDPTSQTGSSKAVRIVGNLCDLTDGGPILGLWLQGQYGALGFDAPEITGNTFLMKNAQGITCKGCIGPKISRNTLLQSGGGPKDAPQIMWFSGTVNGLADVNTTAAVSDLSGSKGPLANTAKGTIKPPGGIVPLGTLTAARAPFLASRTPF